MSEDFDFDNVPAETPLEHRPEEAIARRHRREKKELQGKILALKKSVSKADKKRKKEVDAEIVAMENELHLRHNMEVETLHVVEHRGKALTLQPDMAVLTLNEEQNNSNLSATNDAAVDEELLTCPGTPKISRAQKRRDKKSSEQREVQKRIDTETEELVENSLWKKEDNQFVLILKEVGLEVFDIPADGDCLYSAVSHQLDHHRQPAQSASSLRKHTASYLLSHKDDFIPFMDEQVAASDEAFKNYCTEIANTAVWGGQLEVQVLSKFVEHPIRVMQTDSPPLIFGEEFGEEGPMITLTYHRHKVQAGEHYNSTVPKTEAKEDDA